MEATAAKESNASAIFSLLRRKKLRFQGVGP
jgi:hypothetical protein